MEEIKGLKEMFRNMDANGDGTITYEELRTGLTKLGSKLSESEVKQLMDAVRGLTRCPRLPFLECKGPASR